MTQKLPRQITAEEALVRLEALCARSERCTDELRRKLWQWKIAPSDADRIIESLTSRRFVDDERFARAFIKDKINFARWGQRKIAAALAVKRIPSSTVRRLLDEADPEKIGENLLHVLNAKARGIENVRTYEGRTALFRYAVSRGYLPADISSAIRTHFV